MILSFFICISPFKTTACFYQRCDQIPRKSCSQRLVFTSTYRVPGSALLAQLSAVVCMSCAVCACAADIYSRVRRNASAAGLHGPHLSAARAPWRVARSRCSPNVHAYTVKILVVILTTVPWLIFITTLSSLPLDETVVTHVISRGN